MKTDIKIDNLPRKSKIQNARRLSYPIDILTVTERVLDFYFDFTVAPGKRNLTAAHSMWAERLSGSLLVANEEV